MKINIYVLQESYMLGFDFKVAAYAYQDFYVYYYRP